MIAHRYGQACRAAAEVYDRAVIEKDVTKAEIELALFDIMLHKRLRLLWDSAHTATQKAAKLRRGVSYPRSHWIRMLSTSIQSSGTA